MPLLLLLPLSPSHSRAHLEVCPLTVRSIERMIGRTAQKRTAEADVLDALHGFPFPGVDWFEDALCVCVSWMHCEACEAAVEGQQGMMTTDDM